VLVAAFVALTVALARGHLLGVDQRVYDWSQQHRPAPLYWAARVFNYLGQGGQVLMPVAILLAAWLTWRRRSIRPFLVFAGAFVLLYLTIGPLKIWLDRAAPAFTGPDKLILFNEYASGAKAVSYPSGHLANSLVWYGVIAVLVGALLRAYDRRPLSTRGQVLIRALPPAILFVTTIYTGFHWLTDSVAGLLLGLVLTRLMARVRWDRVPLPRLGGWQREADL
jgi:membrane-associated phospholipid phosphatase